MIDEYETANAITSPNTSDSDSAEEPSPAYDVAKDYVEQARLRRRASLLGVEVSPTLKVATRREPKGRNPLPKRAVSLLGLFRKHSEIKIESPESAESRVSRESRGESTSSSAAAEINYSKTDISMDRHVVDIRGNLQYMKPLGHGTFGRVVLVRVAENADKPAPEFAVKIVSKQRMAATPKDMEMIIREVGVMHALHHPNIVKLWDAFESKHHVLMITDYCAGGDLQSCVLDRVRVFKDPGLLPEWSCKLVMHSVFSALQHLHVRGIAHRDLKLENVMLVHQPGFRENTGDVSPYSNSLHLPDSDPRLWQDVKLTDFGLAGFKDSESQLAMGLSGTTASPIATPGGMGIGTGLMNTRCGTMAYSAPEIVHGRPYNFKVDSWSAGVMLHLLLTSHFPFWSDDAVELMRSVGEGVYRPNATHLQHVSAQAKDLIQKLLSRRPHARPTCEDALKHPWFADVEARTFNETTLLRTVKRVTELRFDATNFFTELPVAAKAASETLWIQQIVPVKEEIQRAALAERMEKIGRRRAHSQVSPDTPDSSIPEATLHPAVGWDRRSELSRSSSVESMHDRANRNNQSPKRRARSPSPNPPPLSEDEQKQLDKILTGSIFISTDVERDLKTEFRDKTGLSAATCPDSKAI